MSRFKQWALVSLCMHACAGVGRGAGRLFLCKQSVERLWQCVPVLWFIIYQQCVLRVYWVTFIFLGILFIRIDLKVTSFRSSVGSTSTSHQLKLTQYVLAIKINCVYLLFGKQTICCKPKKTVPKKCNTEVIVGENKTWQVSPNSEKYIIHGEQYL